MDSPTDSSISLSWTISSDSVVDSYEVVWSSDQCSEGLEGNTIINGSTNYTNNQCPNNTDEGKTSITFTIEGLRGDTSYNITITAINMAGISSDSITAQTLERGRELSLLESLNPCSI